MEEDSGPLILHPQPSHHPRLLAQGKGVLVPPHSWTPGTHFMVRPCQTLPRPFLYRQNRLCRVWVLQGAWPADKRSLLVYSTACPRGQAPRLLGGSGGWGGRAGSTAYREVLRVAQLANL